jgi:ADP-ribosylglycohydrolase
MYGAMIGDMVGRPYEWHNIKKKDFPLFSAHSGFTDDSVMTVAVAEALMMANEMGEADDEKSTKDLIVSSMTKFGLRYPNAGYGGTFYHWLHNRLKEPYNSWGNGSAMRVSPAGWLYDDIETTRKMAAWTAEVTHNHPEGVKGAESVASAIFLARTGSTKDEIRDYIVKEFGYDLSRTCDEIRPDYEFDVSCQGSVPQAITAFLEGKTFEDVIRTAVSLGGDSDTIGAMAGSIAEAFYGVPEDFKRECENRLPDDLLEVLKKFTKAISA